jgi:hypothetical protein
MEFSCDNVILLLLSSQLWFSTIAIERKAHQTPAKYKKYTNFYKTGDIMQIKSLVAALALVAGASFALNASAQAPIVIKFSHVVATDTPKGRAAERFKDLAEKMTKGRVKVELYPNSQLYKDKEELEALQLGAVQMLAPSLAKFAPLGVKEFEVFDLPYIFPSKAALYTVTEGPIGKGLLTKLEPKGITGLAYWDNGFKVMSANKPLHMPADARAGRQPAGAGLLGSLPGAADRRGGRHREPAVEHVHPEDARGAEARDGLEPRLPGLCGHRQQEVLGRPAGRHPRPAAAGHG